MTKCLADREPLPWYLTGKFIWLLNGSITVVVIVAMSMAVATGSLERLLTTLGVYLVVILIVSGTLGVAENKYWRTWRSYRSRVKGVEFSANENLATVLEDDGHRATATVLLENDHRFRASVSLKEMARLPYVTYERRDTFLNGPEYRNIQYITSITDEGN